MRSKAYCRVASVWERLNQWRRNNHSWQTGLSMVLLMDLQWAPEIGSQTGKQRSSSTWGRWPRSPTDSAHVFSGLHPLTSTLSLFLAWGYGLGSGVSSGLGRKQRNGPYMKKWSMLVNVVRMPGAKHIFHYCVIESSYQHGSSCGVRTELLAWTHRL